MGLKLFSLTETGEFTLTSGTVVSAINKEKEDKHLVVPSI